MASNIFVFQMLSRCLLECHKNMYVFQMLSECLLECHKNSVAAGKPLALKVFVSGRNRLENDGATALATAFKVCLGSCWSDSAVAR